MTRAYVALGSNQADPVHQVLAAIEALSKLPDTREIQRSRLYRTPPWGVVDQPDFINAVVAMDTAMQPHAFLDALHLIEHEAGRVRRERNGPRTLDLDLLYMDGVCIDDARLTVPHPRIGERAFVLLPLADVAPGLVLDRGGKSVKALLACADTRGCVALA